MLRADAHSPGGAVVAVRSVGRDLGRLFELALVAFALVAAVAFAVVAVAHVADRAFITYASGSRMGLALYAREGVLYPPIFRDGFYGGTRMMPVPILLHAGLSVLTGEFLASGKLLTYLSFVALLVVAFAAMRAVGASAGRSAVLLAGVSVSAVGIWAAFSVSYDALPIALQLVALALVARGRGRAAIATAGVVCAVALFAKLGAIWGVGAIGAWLWARDRRALVPFLGAYVAASGLAFVLVQLASGGRFLENMVAFSSSGVGDDGIARIPRLFGQMVQTGPILYVLLAFAAIELALAFRERALTIYHVATPFAALTLLIVLTRSGAAFNHFLDLMVLTAILTAALWTRWRDRSLAVVVPIAVTLALFGSYMVLRIEVQEASPRLLQGDVRFLDRFVPRDARILSEDASIPIERGQQPVVLDPFLVPTIGARDPQAVDALVDRVERHEFDRIVLTYPLDDAPGDWYTLYHFGPKLAGAIERNYVLLAGRGTYYYVYAPRRV